MNTHDLASVLDVKETIVYTVFINRKRRDYKVVFLNANDLMNLPSTEVFRVTYEPVRGLIGEYSQKSWLVLDPDVTAESYPAFNYALGVMVGQKQLEVLS
jgi:hypothetical protein